MPSIPHSNQQDHAVAIATRTVSAAAEQFRELKDNAREMLVSRVARDRGHFSPAEDEAVRRLLITYWQLRSATLATIYQLYDDVGRGKVTNHRLFLPGYAGALVLVDAARFLRENFHNEPLLRAKLNEPEPSFDIPADVYETVQSSLTGVTHAWKLYHAAQYFQQNRDMLESLGEGDPAAAEMFDIVDRYSEHLNVRMSDYASARMRYRLRQMRTFFTRDLCFTAMYRIQKLAGDLMADFYVKPKHQPGMPKLIKQELCTHLRPGDVMLTRKEYALTNYLLPGFWPHAALYMGDQEALSLSDLHRHEHVGSRWETLMNCDPDDSGRVLESMADGVHVRSIKSPYRCDSLIILRPQLSTEEIQDGLVRGLHHEGKDYDFNFDFARADRLVCTEVVYRSYDGVGGMEFPLTRRTGRLTLAAEELVRMGLSDHQFEIVVTYIPEAAEGVLVGDRALEKVQPLFP
ncbi:MAG: YiiX/YebB-like N1pC/P60 family cysteine hydrolase [Planctomycetaceae bacterium]|jgi:hypothetical protein|nr:YiiX/YebB-like N1pC/P60 family cysteine hydrolase [Planctomycetaceae bacterium]